MQRLADITDAPTAWQCLGELADECQGNLAFDIGANTGQACAVLGPYFDQVIAFEPAAESAAVLLDECRDNVDVRTKAVSAKPGYIDLAVADQAIAFGQLVTAEALAGHAEWGTVIATRKVAATTVDEVVGEEGRLPSLIKVDTEGHECQVVAGAEHTIALGYSTWFIEVHSRAYRLALTEAFLRYDVTLIEHDYLVAGSDRSFDHYYMVARPR